MFDTGDYKEVLQKYISPDQLPAAYGGTRCEPDPYCTKYVGIFRQSSCFEFDGKTDDWQVNPGGDIPENYYLVNVMETDKNEMERVTIGRGSTRLVPFDVAKPGTILKLEIASQIFAGTVRIFVYAWL